MSRVEVQSEPLTGNRRYVVLNTADKHYLVDTDAPFFLIQLFPFLIWFIQHKCYEITPKQWSEISGPRVEEAMSPGDVGMLGGGLSLLAGPWLLKISNLTSFNNQLLGNIIFFGGIVGVVLIRIYSVKRKKITSSYFDEKKMIRAKIKLSFGDMMKDFSIFFCIVLAILMTTLVKFFVNDDLLITAGSLFFIYIYLIMNEGVWKWSEETYLEIDN